MSALTESAPGNGRSVLWILHGEEIGGASLSVLRLRERIEQLGWRITVWAPDPSELADEARARGFEVFGASRPIAGYSWRAMKIAPGPLPRVLRAPRYYRSLLDVIRASRPLLAHCNSMYTLDEAAFVKAFGIRTVFHVHEMIGDSVKHRVARNLIHRIGDVVIGVSEAGAAALTTPHRSARVVPEGTDTTAPPIDRTPCSGAMKVGMVGVIARRKGPDLFVEAARIVRDRLPEVEFQLVGSITDPLDANWASQVLSDAATVGVDWIERTDVPEAMAGWDLFVLPSRVDPFPIVVLEAMSSGLPVVATRVDGIEEQLRDGAGLLVEPDNAQALAEAIIDLAGNPSRRTELGRAGRARVVENFSLDRQAAALSSAYEDALAPQLGV